MKAVGIMLIKEKSERFPDKNIFPVDGRPMFAHNIDVLQKCKLIDEIYILTDSMFVENFCHSNYLDGKSLGLIKESRNLTREEQDYFDVLKYAYQCIDKRYDIIVSILANSINHKIFSVNSGIQKMINDPKVQEIRSFDSLGNQSGIFIFRESIIINNHEMSHHMAAINSNGKEIHYREEIDE
jgi:CMP-N-acetylneuraminic acid synthetase